MPAAKAKPAHRPAARRAPPVSEPAPGLDLAPAIDAITRHYLAARYGPARSGELAALEAAIRAFRPGRKPG